MPKNSENNEFGFSFQLNNFKSKVKMGDKTIYFEISNIR